ncbi:hypothetical protein HYPSUDRAFT_151852, partial [Hypholoma sublateritium FD-334 SS-4]
FLDAQKEVYAAAVAENHVNDTVADIQCRYFKRFPLTLSHSEEPTEESLAAVDDDAPDPELSPPRDDGLNPDAYSRAKRVYEFQCRELKMRQAVGLVAKKFEMGSSDRMAILAAKLTGNTATKPRLRTAYNLWGPQNCCFQAALRSAIYKEMFEELPPNEQREWAEKAEDEHHEALKKIAEPLDTGPSTTPQDRQRIIECFPQFIEPILDLIADHTGWKLSLIAGGPEPADGGRLGILSVHSGTTTGPVKMTFGRSERVAFKELVTPTFARFLKKCYCEDSCYSSQILPPVKFGPPRNGTKLPGAKSLSTGTPITLVTPAAALEKIVNVPPCSTGAPSRGPTPPISRAQSPQPPTELAVSDGTRVEESVKLSHIRCFSPWIRVCSGHAAARSGGRRERASKCKGRALSMGPQSKKRKASGRPTSNLASSSRTVSGASSQDSSATLVDAPNAPAWATTCLELFRSIALGSEWDALLSNWVAFELGLGFQGPMKLGMKNRPRIVADWIQRARTPTFRAEIKNDWECLRRPGINGLLSVIAALFFWGCTAQKLPNAGVAWLEAVDDVSYSIAQLL